MEKLGGRRYKRLRRFSLGRETSSTPNKHLPISPLERGKHNHQEKTKILWDRIFSTKIHTVQRSIVNLNQRRIYLYFPLFLLWVIELAKVPSYRHLVFIVSNSALRQIFLRIFGSSLFSRWNVFCPRPSSFSSWFNAPSPWSFRRRETKEKPPKMKRSKW